MDLTKKIISFSFVFITFFCFVGKVSAQKVPLLIPHPSEIKMGDGTFCITPFTGITNSSTTRNGEFLKNYIESDIQLILQERKGKNQICLIEDASLTATLGNEGYKLRIRPDQVTVTAAGDKGVFYGIQTLRQLIDRADTSLPCLDITDQPGYSWRAMMLDESRYLKGKQTVKYLLDKMAFLKMNVFHWHLTDDQGWRIEIKQYPNLTEIAGFRDSSEINGWHSNVFDGKPHGGYYTQDDIREIVAYAADRQITVVPEIEMPGHATAVVAAYPEVGVLEDPIRVPCKFGVSSSVFNVADPKVITFIHNVLDEVFALFPSQVVHIGGDEIHFEEWKASKEINRFMKKNKLKNYNDLQLYFTNQMSHFFEKSNRRMMGWNDIMGKNIHEWSDENSSVSGSLSSDAIIHFWKGDSTLIREALEKGHQVVNSTHSYTYLDYSAEKIPLEKAYGFTPFPKGMDPKLKPQLIGLGCQMWCEWVPKQSDLMRQVFPRLAAYAEVGWTVESQKDFERFSAGLSHFYDYDLLPEPVK